MSHLASKEMVKCVNGFYMSLFGAANYERWKRLKSLSKLPYETEEYFVAWVLDHCEEYLKKLNTSVTQSVREPDEEVHIVGCHLKLPELTNCLNTVYMCIFGVTNFGRWKWIKTQVSTPTHSEEEFMTWVLDVAERSFYGMDPVEQQQPAAAQERDTSETAAGADTTNDIVAAANKSATSKDGTIEIVVPYGDVKTHLSSSCRFCPKIFSSYRCRLEHEKTDHACQLNYYPCKVCNKLFMSAESRVQHVRNVHNKEKKICPECGRCFCISYITTHMRVAHGNVRFGCDHCGKEFKTKNNMLKHKKKYHIGL